MHNSVASALRCSDEVQDTTGSQQMSDRGHHSEGDGSFPWVRLAAMTDRYSMFLSISVALACCSPRYRQQHPKFESVLHVIICYVDFSLEGQTRFGHSTLDLSTQGQTGLRVSRPWIPPQGSSCWMFPLLLIPAGLKPPPDWPLPGPGSAGYRTSLSASVLRRPRPRWI